MPQILEPNYDIREPAPNRIRWTRQQCVTLADASILTGRYELIEGEIISKMGQKRPHAVTITIIIGWLNALFGDEFIQCQLPIEVPGEDNNYSEPEPDVTVLRFPATHYLINTPGAEDVLLLVEVADSSLVFDRTTKAALYSRAAIADYWIIDVANRKIMVHRKPSLDGYAEIVAYTEDEVLETLARPDAPIRVSKLLPPE